MIYQYGVGSIGIHITYMGKESEKHSCICITESHCCTPETNTTLLINYTSIRKRILEFAPSPKYKIFVIYCSAIGKISRLLFFSAISSQHHHCKERFLPSRLVPNFLFSPQNPWEEYSLLLKGILFHLHDNKKTSSCKFYFIYYINVDVSRTEIHIRTTMVI